jgi:hypothetical protein
MAIEKVDRPDIVIRSRHAPMFFMGAKVSKESLVILGLAWQFRHFGVNLYRVFSNRELAKQMFTSEGKFMRAKRELRDKNLLDYDCEPGDYSELIKRWEKATGVTWTQ